MPYECPQCKGTHPICTGHADGDPCPACQADNEYRSRGSEPHGGMYKVGVRP